ncbi:hypothetical protein B7494_g5650 [Chlorociboria aeruginascens]|nr:hypothetical protein B7494_g5650 [Chlorociboria aeruginascens]
MASRKLLVINPNSSKSMTQGLESRLDDLGPSHVFHISFYTALAGPDSINDENDALESGIICLKDLEPVLSEYDAFLVACYSVHPLVSLIRERVRPGVHVMGIFEASITTSLSLLDYTSKSGAERFGKFGIVSTGRYWSKALSEGLAWFLGHEDIRNCAAFKRVETTGLTAAELHTTAPEVVRRKMSDATKRLVKDRDVKAICLGCAGMAGMDSIVEEALIEELGEQAAKQVYIVDGFKAGVVLLEGLVRALPSRE